VIVIVALAGRRLQDRNSILTMGVVSDAACVGEVIRCPSGAAFTEMPELGQDGDSTWRVSRLIADHARPTAAGLSFQEVAFGHQGAEAVAVHRAYEHFRSGGCCRQMHTMVLQLDLFVAGEAAVPGRPPPHLLTQFSLRK
jgi:hypothetical protein